MTTITRMKDGSYRPLKDISTTNIRNDISTIQSVICILYIAYVYRRDDCIGMGLELVGLCEVWE